MERRYDIDAIRVLAFGFLMLYHLGMVFVADWGYHIKSPHQWEWLQWPMITVNRWRMPLIFLVSGLALGLARPDRALTRSGGRRSLRLLVPLIFGMLAIVPVQAYCEAVADGAVEPGFLRFMVRYLELRPWPEGGFAGADYGVTWNHLWYLAYLWAYTMVLFMGVAALRALGIAGGFLRGLSPSRWPMPLVLLVPVAWLFFCLYWVEPRFPKTYALLDDGFSHAYYFPVFAFGYAVACSTAFWERLDRGRWVVLSLMVTGFTLYMGLRLAGRGLSPQTLAKWPDWNWGAISNSGHAMYLWGMLLTILAFSRRWLNRPFPGLDRANRAIYPWYILHQSLIVPLAFYLSPLSLPGGVEVLLILLGTIAGCLFVSEVVLQHVPVLRPVFGVFRSRRSPPPSVQAVQP